MTSAGVNDTISVLADWLSDAKPNGHPDSIILTVTLSTGEKLELKKPGVDLDALTERYSEVTDSEGIFWYRPGCRSTVDSVNKTKIQYYTELL